MAEIVETFVNYEIPRNNSFRFRIVLKQAVAKNKLRSNPN